MVQFILIRKFFRVLIFLNISIASASDIFEESDSKTPRQNSIRSSTNLVDQTIQSARLDLHGYSVKKAKETTINVIKKLHGIGATHLHIICGRGNHENSDGSRGVLFKNFPTWLNDPTVSSLVKEVKKGIGTYDLILNKYSGIHQDLNSLGVNEKALYKNAKKGDANAQYQIAKAHYEKGDWKTGIEWARKAARRGSSESMVLLGMAHALGKGVLFDPKAAMGWYQKAAVLGSNDACLNLGTMFWSGEAGVVDLKKTVFWYKQSAKRNHIESQRMLGIVLRKLGQDEEAVEWDYKAAQQGDLPAYVNLGSMYQIGRGVPKDESRAVKYFMIAAEGGIAEGQMRAGLAFLNGHGVEPDYIKAYQYLLMAAVSGSASANADAQYFLSEMYREGKGIETNEERAQYWLFKAAENNQPQAQWKKGKKAEQEGNNLEALEWYKKSAEQGNQNAVIDLGIKLGWFKIPELEEGNQVPSPSINEDPKSVQIEAQKIKEDISLKPTDLAEESQVLFSLIKEDSNHPTHIEAQEIKKDILIKPIDKKEAPKEEYIKIRKARLECSILEMLSLTYQVFKKCILYPFTS